MMKINTRCVPVTLPDGRKFDSIRECAKAFGVCPTTVIHHLNHASLEKLGTGHKSRRGCKKTVVDGVTYKSRVEAMYSLGITREQLMQRIDK
jgi:DNA-binding transcriptional regulator YhcF (GntR family)